MVNIDSLYKKLDSLANLKQGWQDGDLGDVIVEETIKSVKEVLNYIEATNILNSPEIEDPLLINLDPTYFGDVELLLFNQHSEIQILIKFDKMRSYYSIRGRIDFKVHENVNELKDFLCTYLEALKPNSEVSQEIDAIAEVEADNNITNQNNQS